MAMRHHLPIELVHDPECGLLIPEVDKAVAGAEPCVLVADYLHVQHLLVHSLEGRLDELLVHVFRHLGRFGLERLETWQRQTLNNSNTWNVITLTVQQTN